MSRPRPQHAPRRGPLLITTLLLWAAISGQAQPVRPHQQPIDDASSKQADQAGATDPVLATYRGGEVRASELEILLSTMPPNRRADFQGPEGRAALLDEALRFELLTAEALRRGYDKDLQVQQQVKTVAVQQLIERRVDAQVHASDVSESDVAAYYKENYTQFNQPEYRRASHIQLKTKAEAETLLAELAGKDLRAFRQAAQHKSTDEVTKLRGGDLRYFERDGDGEGGAKGPASELAAAAFTLEHRGQLHSTPLKTANGFSLLMLTGVKAASHRPQSSVEALIRNRLVQQRRQQALDALIAKLKTELSPSVQAELMMLVKFKPKPGDLPEDGRLPKGFPEQRPGQSTPTKTQP